MYVLTPMIGLQDEPGRAIQSGSDQCSTHMRVLHTHARLTGDPSDQC